jgi:hypothetical protein
MTAKRMDIAGRRYGRLTVLGFAGMNGIKSTWHCRCDCGTECVALGQSLAQGERRSCGCLRREQARTNGRAGAHLLVKRKTKRSAHPLDGWAPSVRGACQ